MTERTPRRAKAIAPEAVGDLIRSTLRDGDTVVLGGLFKQNRPVALVRELIRTGIGGLKLFSSPGSGYDVDLMIAAGVVAETYLPAVTLEDRLCPNFRAAVESGKVRAHAVDALTIVGGLMAAAHGIPFHPVAAWKGSDVVRLNPLAKAITCPFTGESLHAVPAIRPKLALLHAQEGDAYGNIRHLTTMTYADSLIARAAETVIVSVDHLVRPEAITARPRETTIPCIYVDAVVEIPYGAHPTASFPHYAMDEAHIEAFAHASEAARKAPGDAGGLSDYLRRFVHCADGIHGYLDEIGPRRLAELEHEARFV